MSTELNNAIVTVITADTQRGNGNAVNTAAFPRAMGTMGLSPSEVEMTAVVASQRKIEEYLTQFPEDERKRIRSTMFKDYEEMDRIKF